MSPASDERDLARRYVWWKPVEDTLADPVHLLCQVMQLGSYEDVALARRHYGDDALRAALRSAPPGVLDARSWTFWHRVLFRAEPPPMPVRETP